MGNKHDAVATVRRQFGRINIGLYCPRTVSNSFPSLSCPCRLPKRWVTHTPRCASPTGHFVVVARCAGTTRNARSRRSPPYARATKTIVYAPDLAVTTEEKQTYAANAIATHAQYEQAVANLKQAQVNLERTEIRAPVDGWVTNLLAQRGDYATAGQNLLSLTDANSFWVDGYFEESGVDPIQVGDSADVKLMGYSPIVRGHVESIARAINVANAQPNGQGVATVNPIFIWVRLAQRIPVRIQIDQVPKGVVLVAGMTATVQIDTRADHLLN
jgi:multidrug resistance efflux pump